MDTEQRRRPARRVHAPLLVVGALFGLVACASSGADESSPGSEPATTIATVTSSDGVTTTTELEVEVTDITSTVAPTTNEGSVRRLLDEPPVDDRPLRPGAQRLHFEVGPLDVKSGQNNIALTAPGIAKPDSGYITRVDPDLRLADGSVPAVDVIHLHHGVWLNISARDASSGRRGERFFAAGEEKTITLLPEGYGYPVQQTDVWLLNYMIHNLWPEETQVWVTYDIDIIPFDAPEAAGIVPARPIWMDVENGELYPVFDVHRGDGTDGLFVYPDDVPDAYADGRVKNEWVADRDGIILSTAGHLHPGGLQTDLWVSRGDQRANLFTSEAYYYEPAGAVSWDVSMTATPEDYRAQVRAGDVLSTTATYDSETASWYESMGIMVTWMADAPAPGDSLVPADPFASPLEVQGLLTHGHLPENDNHGGDPTTEYVDLTALATGDAVSDVPIADYRYAEGDMLHATTLPTVAQGGTISFDNLDAPLANGIWHTITACKAPCNRTTGIAYPLADGDIDFDSGQLGLGGEPTANRTTWSTPDDLPVGTYTYFCRIHPFMRGGFAVVPG